MCKNTHIPVQNGSVTTKLPSKSVTTFVGEAKDVNSKVQSPLKEDELNSFKQDRTVPVKLKLKDSEGHYIEEAEAKLFVAEVSDGVVGEEKEATSSGHANQGNHFRYDSDANQYIFNFNTRVLPKGNYQLRIEVGGHTVDTVQINLE